MFRIKCDATKQDIVSRHNEHILYPIYIIHLHQTKCVLCALLRCRRAGRFVCVTTSHAIFHTHTAYRLHTDFSRCSVVFSSSLHFACLFCTFFCGKLLPFNVSHVSHTNTHARLLKLTLTHSWTWTCAVSAVFSTTVLAEMPTRSLFALVCSFTRVLSLSLSLPLARCHDSNVYVYQIVILMIVPMNVWWCAF